MRSLNEVDDGSAENAPLFSGVELKELSDLVKEHMPKKTRNHLFSWEKYTTARQKSREAIEDINAILCELLIKIDDPNQLEERQRIVALYDDENGATCKCTSDRKNVPTDAMVYAFPDIKKGPLERLVILARNKVTKWLESLPASD